MDARDLVKAYRRQLDIGFATLRFAPSIEAAFRRSQFERKRSLTRLGMLLAAALYSLFLLLMLNSPTSGDFLLFSSLLRGSVVLCILLTAWGIHRVNYSQAPVMLSATYLIFALSFSGIAVLSFLHDMPFHYEGMLFAVFHCALFSGLLFRHCLSITLGMSAVFVGFNFAYHLPTQALMYEAFFLSLSIVMANASLYQAEYIARDSFLRRGIMRASANFDELTGLASRAAFDHYLRSHLRQNAGLDPHPQALVLLDIDYFKQLNDSRGHATGDKCLQLVSDILKNGVDGAEEASARWGGDELIAVLPVRGEAELATRLEAIRLEVSAMEMANPRTPSKKLSVSIGGLLIEPEKRLAESELFRQVDAALYQAKEQGRNQVVIQHAAALNESAPA